MQANSEVATLAGGCFWCLEAIFSQMRGVERVIPGYAGGSTIAPNYEQVCAGNTGHAEAVQATFDPKVVSFKDLLETFFSMHDPTTLNRQGADVGTQYRSAIFYHNEEQKTIAEEAIKKIDASKIWDNPVVTTVEPFVKFYTAEDYHQNYYENNSAQPYCRAVIDPKLVKFRKQYGDRLKM